MTTNELITFFAFKILCLLVGLASIYWGYKLFLKGFIEIQGKLELEHKQTKVSLQNAAPGIFFLLLGSFIAIFTIIKGFQYKSNDKDSSTEIHFSPPPK